MQEAIPYKTWLPRHQETTLNNRSLKDNLPNDLKGLVREKPVIVFARRGCCMSHVVKRLLQGQGIDPQVYEVDEEAENGVVNELETVAVAAGGRNEGRVEFPAVFIGGRLFGSLDRVIATHITGELTLVLKQAGALWL